jgi:hypothetical protein
MSKSILALVASMFVACASEVSIVDGKDVTELHTLEMSKVCTAVRAHGLALVDQCTFLKDVRVLELDTERMSAGCPDTGSASCYRPELNVIYVHADHINYSVAVRQGYVRAAIELLSLDVGEYDHLNGASK